MSDIFTDEDREKAEGYDTLGVDYFAAQRIADNFMKQFKAEHFKPLVERFTDEFRDKLWSDLDDWLVMDTESNMQTTIWNIVKGTVEALLTGEEWAMRRYPYADYTTGEKVRAKLMEHCGDEVAKLRVADLEKENARLREQLENARRY